MSKETQNEKKKAECHQTDLKSSMQDSLDKFPGLKALQCGPITGTMNDDPTNPDEVYHIGPIQIEKNPWGIYIDTTLEPRLTILEIDGKDYSHLLSPVDQAFTKYLNDSTSVTPKTDPLSNQSLIIMPELWTGKSDERGNLEIDTRGQPPKYEKLIINGIDQTSLINPDYRVQPSAMIGKKGEEYIIDILKGAYPEVKVENISSKSRAGDILFRPHLQTVGHQAQIMFEVKKYTAKVPTAQYEKFLRDIRESNHDAGVFISLTSAITGVTDSIVIDTIVTERDGTTVPVIIASTNDKHIIQSLTSLIIGYVTLLRKKGAFVQQSDFAVRLIGSLQTSLNAYNGIRSKVHELRAVNEKMLDGIQESLATNYTEIRVLLNQIQGLIEVDDDVEPTELEVEKLTYVVCPYEYPKSINQFLILLDEKRTKYLSDTPNEIDDNLAENMYKIDYQSDKKIVINKIRNEDYTIELSVLKTKINCTIGPFFSNDNIYDDIHALCSRMTESGDVSLGAINKMFPFESYTISKKSLKFELTPKMYDIVVNFGINTYM
jgi:hypothetical protein